MSASPSPPFDRKQNLDQRRAAHAWDKVSTISKADERTSQDYTGEAHKLPVRIMSSGLGQALAFLFAKTSKKPGLKALIRDLSEWVLVKRLEGSAIQVPAQAKPNVLPTALDKAGKSSGGTSPSPADLLQAVIHGNTEFLRWATDETLAWLQWVNRFAEGLGHDKDPGTDE